VDSFKPLRTLDKLNRLPAVRRALAKDLKRALEKTLPDAGWNTKLSGEQPFGSLGQERFVAIGKWQAAILREKRR